MKYLYDGEQENELQQYKISEKLWNGISAAFERAAKYIHSKGGYKAEYLTDDEVKPLIDKTYEAFSEAVDYGLRDNEIPTAMRLYLQDNVFVFSGFKAHTELRQASALLRDASGQIKPFNRFLSDIQKIDKTYNKTYLQAEYNFAVASSQAAARWQEISEGGDNFLLQYRTAKDERVREQHRLLDGITLPPSDKFWDEYYVPLGWNCRCSVVQVNPRRYPQSVSEEALQRGRAATYQPNAKGQNKAQIFRFNSGKQKVVFPPKHPYYPKGCGNCNLKQFKAGKGKPECALCVYNEVHFGEYINLDPKEWKPYRYDFKTNGYIAIHRLHDFKWKKEKNDVPHKLTSGEAELKVANYLCDRGYRVKMLKEKNNKGEKQSPLSSPDCDVNGVLCDIKYANTHNVETLKKHIRKAKSQKAKAIILYSDDETNFAKIYEAYIRAKVDIDAYVLVEGQKMIKIER